MTSSLLGAAVAIGTVAFFGGLGSAKTEQIVQRVGVRDIVADPFEALRDRTPDGLPEVVAAVSPSVVRLEVPASSGALGGSGLVVLDDGHILTNAHVVGDADDVTIVRSDGRAVAGEIVGVDELTDLAVVAAVDASLEWTPVVQGSASELRIGDPAVSLSAASEPGEPSVGLGVVAAVAQWMPVDSELTLHGLIETDLSLAATSSGGALCDRAGRVVGLTTTAIGDDAAGLSYATAIDVAWPVVEALIRDGVVRHAWLGIVGADLAPTESSVLGINNPAGGVIVDDVLGNSAAAAAGMQPGDVLHGIEGQRIGSMSELVLVLRNHQPGDEVIVSVVRDGAAIDLVVQLDQRE